MITIPQPLVQNTLNRAGEAGRRWLEALPELVETLCGEWRLVVDGAPMHGYMSLVVPVRRDGEALVLKISGFNESTTYEATALAAWDGDGAARLLEADTGRGVLLLERLDHSLALEALPLSEAISVAGGLLRRLAVPDPGSLPMLREMAMEIAGSLPERWQRAGRPFAEGVLNLTVETAVRLAPAAQNLLVNYDLHGENILAGQRQPWLAVDPKVVIGDPEFGIAQLLWRRLEEIESAEVLEAHFQLLVRSAELDEELARSWTLVRTVDYWLWALSVGFTGDPRRCRRLTTWLVP